MAGKSQRPSSVSTTYVPWRPSHWRAIGSPNNILIAAVSDARTRPAVQDKMSQGTANMDDHETRRKIIREWMARRKRMRKTACPRVGRAGSAAESAAAVEFGSRPALLFSSHWAYAGRLGWLLPRASEGSAKLANVAWARLPNPQLIARTRAHYPPLRAAVREAKGPVAEGALPSAPPRFRLPRGSAGWTERLAERHLGFRGFPGSRGPAAPPFSRIGFPPRESSARFPFCRSARRRGLSPRPRRSTCPRPRRRR